MQKIIVTADDYGMCDVVDKAIDEGIESGFITTTNVMVNMETLHNAADLRQRFPHISVGVHWNVTTGKPVSDVNEIRSLVDENGSFWSITEFKQRFSKGMISSAELEKELDAQYTLFEKMCGKADYWNTHENSSLHIKAFTVFKKVAKKHGITATRTFKRVYYDKLNLAFKRELREFLVRNFFNVWFTQIKRIFKMPVARVVSFDQISKTDGDVLLNAIKKDGRNYIEIVFHPSVSSEHKFFGNISDERVKEYKFVSSEEIVKKYKSNGIEFVNFSEL